MFASHSGHLEVVKALADVNAKNREGLTPLMLAAKGGHLEVVGALIDAGVDENQENESGQTAAQIWRKRNE